MLSLNIGQFHYQMEGKPYFLKDVRSYRVKFINSTITVVEVMQLDKTVTLSLPSSSVWWSDAKDNTDWEHYE